MRVHGVQVHGLRIPPGETRLDFDPGYNVVVAGRAANVLTRLLFVPLFPSSELELVRAWLELADSNGPALLSAGLSFGSEAFRVVVDLRQMQIAIARHDSVLGATTRMAKGAVEVGAELSKRGVPPTSAFRLLHVYGCVGPGAGIPEPAWWADTLPDVPFDPETDAERLKQLREARDRPTEVERQLATAAEELRSRSALAESLEELDSGIARYRSRAEVRDRELTAVEQTRRALLQEHLQLCTVPPMQRNFMALGMACGAMALVMAPFAGGLLYAAAVVGFGVALLFALLARAGRRTLGRVEARLSGLRIKERSVQQSFDGETRELADVATRLGAGSIEELVRQLAEYHELSARLERLRGELDEAQRAFPKSARDELEHLDRFHALHQQVSAARTGPKGPANLAAPGTGRVDGLHASSFADPEDLIRAGEAASGKAASEVRERMMPSLPLYLRVLTEGRIQQVRRGQEGVWLVRRGDAASWQSVSELEEDAEVVGLAFRLAILEGLAPVLRIPLIIGPELRLGTEAGCAALGRALRRLGSVLQIVHVTSSDAAWNAHAMALQRLPDPESNAAR